MENVKSPMQSLFLRGNPLISKKVTHKDAVKEIVLQIKKIEYMKYLSALQA